MGYIFSRIQKYINSQAVNISSSIKCSAPTTIYSKIQKQHFTTYATKRANNNNISTTRIRSSYGVSIYTRYKTNSNQVYLYTPVYVFYFPILSLK
jgi:myo-inositol-hexaphosphate 3-phosphohydrolase